MSTVDGILEAAKETGANVEEVAKVTVSGAIEAAGVVGTSAVNTVRRRPGRPGMRSAGRQSRPVPSAGEETQPEDQELPAETRKRKKAD